MRIGLEISDNWSCWPFLYREGNGWVDRRRHLETLPIPGWEILMIRTRDRMLWRRGQGITVEGRPDLEAGWNFADIYGEGRRTGLLKEKEYLGEQVMSPEAHLYDLLRSLAGNKVPYYWHSTSGAAALCASCRVGDRLAGEDRTARTPFIVWDGPRRWLELGITPSTNRMPAHVVRTAVSI